MNQTSFKTAMISAGVVVLLITSVALGEMSSVRLNAKVKSFDEKFVTIQLNKRTVRIPRSVVADKELKAGGMVQITFRGEEIDYLFPPDRADGSSERSPASENEK